jgi:hypothetical protein
MRRLFTLVSALFLLLSVATVVLWARSYWRSDAIYLSRWSLYSISSSKGGVVWIVRTSVYTHFDGTVTSEPFSPVWSISYSPEADFPRIALWDSEHGALGAGYCDGMEFLWVSVEGSEDTRCRMVALPYWMLSTAALAVVSVYPLRSIRSAGRARRSQCVRCGYDLRASPERCPECGTRIHSPPSAP